MFDNLAFSPKFIEVERNIFKEIPLELIISQTTRNNVNLEILDSAIINNPPPRRRLYNPNPWQVMPSYGPPYSGGSSYPSASSHPGAGGGGGHPGGGFNHPAGGHPGAGAGQHGAGGYPGGRLGQGSGVRRVSGPGSSSLDSPRDRGSPYSRPSNNNNNSSGQ